MVVRWLISILVLGACGGADDTSPARQVRPGAAIGDVAVGARYDEVRARFGELEDLQPFNRIVLGSYPALGLELMLASAEQTTVSDDAVVISVALRGLSPVPTEGVQPGMTRAEIEAVLGEAPEALGEVDYYPAGISVEYGDDGRATGVGVFAAYTLAPVPPPMTQATP